MAGEVCARCLWTGPATSAPDGMCPVCGAPLPLARASAAPERLDAAPAANALDMPDAFAAPAGADDEAIAGAPTDDPYAADLSLLSSDDDAHVARVFRGATGARSGNAGLLGISAGRWALLAMNVGLLAIFIALVVPTARGWRLTIAGVANASSANPTATATTPASVIPSTGPSVLFPTPTATTTPTAAPSGSGGVGAPTATTAPTVVSSPTPRPTAVSGG